jgi:hypothetical protein
VTPVFSAPSHRNSLDLWSGAASEHMLDGGARFERDFSDLDWLHETVLTSFVAAHAYKWEN